MHKMMVTTLVALAVAATGLGLQAPASANPTRTPAVSVQNNVTLTYEEPVRDGQGRITWGWSLSNNSGDAVAEVVLTHQVTPTMPVSSSVPCEGTAEKITCKFGELEAGGVRMGEVVGEGTADQIETAEIRGAVTWTAGSEPEPAT
ncbi:hypothetical protein ACF06X_33030 [Streptomyces sp. NPDC015346]|uniref:hypothetical protein n=1 Tax=Streptomyces sp. NPDC015346 TaxID=3364954 RepID=UPI0036FE6F72